MSTQHSAEAARNGNRGTAASSPVTGSGGSTRLSTLSTSQSTPSSTASQSPLGQSNGTADRLPRPPGRRRPGLAALAILLIVLGGAGAGLLALRIDQRQPVLVAKHDIANGQQITNADLAVARVAGDGLSMISADNAGQVIGQYATTRIPAGRLIDNGMVGTTGLLGPGKAAAGLSLEAGRFPASGLESGDVVQVVRSVDGRGQVISDQAIVGSVQDPQSGVFGDGSQNTVVTVVVNQQDAANVAAAGASNQVTLVLLRRGDPAGTGQ